MKMMVMMMSSCLLIFLISSEFGVMIEYLAGYLCINTILINDKSCSICYSLHEAVLCWIGQLSIGPRQNDGMIILKSVHILRQTQKFLS